MKKINMIGRKFGRLRVTREAPSRRAANGEKRPYWQCLCDCGVEKEVHVANLRNGTTKSCGCLARETICQSGALCSRWRGGKTKTKAGYIRVSILSGAVRTRVFEHVLVMEKYLGRKLRPEETVHHKNGVRDDNRIANLELWSGKHCSGQRMTDLVAWAKEVLQRYDSPIVSPCCV